jgi:hypothetical protein
MPTASSTRSRSSAETGRSANSRSFRPARIASHVSMAVRIIRSARRPRRRLELVEQLLWAKQLIGASNAASEFVGFDDSLRKAHASPDELERRGLPARLCPTLV